MTAAQVQAQEEHAKRIMNTIGINELDSLTTIPTANSGSADYWPTYIPFAKARKRVETLFSQLTDQFLVIRNYAKDTCGFSPE